MAGSRTGRVRRAGLVLSSVSASYGSASAQDAPTIAHLAGAPSFAASDMARHPSSALLHLEADGTAPATGS